MRKKEAKMRARIIFGVMIISMLAAGILFAQPLSFVEQRLNRLKAELNLTEKQSDDLRTILLNEQKEAKQVRQENKGNPEAVRSAMIDLRERTNQQIKNILTTEQQKKFETIKNDSPAPGGMENRELNDLKERLKLTDDQVAKIEPILTSAREEMQELRQNRTGDRQEMRSRVESIFEERDKQLEEILTDSQKKEYEKYLQERREQMMKRRGQWLY
jgi:protein CpxP